MKVNKHLETSRNVRSITLKKADMMYSIFGVREREHHGTTGELLMRSWASTVSDVDSGNARPKRRFSTVHNPDLLADFDVGIPFFQFFICEVLGGIGVKLLDRFTPKT